jgi:SAM-dependent methyltransferase
VDNDRNIAACLLCGSPSFQRMKGYEKDHLVRCRACSFVFSGIRPTPAELDAAYSGYSRDNARTDATSSKMRRTAETLVRLASARKVIDIGCGDGTFAAIFKVLGCDTYGTEYDERTQRLCEGKGLRMLPGGVIPQVPAADFGSFDLVIFTEVIEHINNPREVLAHISRLLRKGGCLYVTTPNFASVDRLLMGPEWGMIKYPEHIALWTPRTLSGFLRGRGYEKVFQRTENVSVYRIVQYLDRRKAGRSSKPAFDPEALSDRAQDYVGRSRFLSFAKRVVNVGLDLTGTGCSLIALYRKVSDDAAI